MRKFLIIFLLLALALSFSSCSLLANNILPSNEVKCASCGKENNGDSEFCIYCGYQFPEEPQNDGTNDQTGSDVKKICTACGAENRKDSSFCSSCGNPFASDSNSSNNNNNNNSNNDNNEDNNNNTPSEDKTPAEIWLLVRESDSDGTVFTEYAYDKMGRQIEMTMYVDDKSTILAQGLYTYDAEGFQTHYTSVTALGYVSTGYYENSFVETPAGKKLSERTKIASDGTVKERETFSYDEKGALKEVRLYDANGTPSSSNTSVKEYKDGIIQKEYFGSGVVSTEYIYDDEGRLIYKKSYDNTGELIAEITFTHDVHGNTITGTVRNYINNSTKTNYYEYVSLKDYVSSLGK